MTHTSKPIVLIGFMATGKTTVGRLVAARTHRTFVDLDAAIVAEANMPIPEIFRAEGEPGFRRREAAALDKALLDVNAVIATGGGAACREDNLRKMLQQAFVVALWADAEEVIKRVGQRSGRPLLDGADDPQAVARKLLHEREPFYARAHARVQTVGRTPEAVADDVIAGHMDHKES